MDSGDASPIFHESMAEPRRELRQDQCSHRAEAAEPAARKYYRPTIFHVTPAKFGPGMTSSPEPHLPKANQLGLRSVFRGWPTFTPDGRFIIGSSSQLQGFVMAGGCNAHGVSGSAGIGRHVVESMLEDTPSDYVCSLSPDRFAASSWNWKTARRDAQHYYETYYSLGY